MTSDPITARLSQEVDALSDNNPINSTHTHWYVFLDCIQSRRKPVQKLGDIRQESSIKVEQDHMVMTGKYRGWEGDI